MANKFFRDKMKLQTPLGASGNLMPKSKEVQAALSKIKVGEDHDTHQLILDLQATPVSVLWPGSRDAPPNHVGVFHHAVNQIKKTPDEKSAEKRKKGSGQKPGSSN